MSRRRRERALRQVVADLARLHPDDVEAILGALEPAEKARIEALAAGLAGGPPREPAPPEEPTWSYEGVSPWLLDRIDPEGRSGARPGRDFVLMTPASAEALRAAALPLRTEGGPGGKRGETLIDKAIAFLAGGRT